MSLTNKTISNMAKLTEVDEYMKHKRFTRPIQKRLKMYYKFRTFRTGSKQDRVNNTLTERLKLEIQLYCNMKLVDKLPIFHELPPRLLRNVIPHLKEEVYLPGDILIRANTEGDCMFFLIHGTVSVISSTGREYAHMKDGSFFGETELILKDQRRVFNIIAIEICEVFVLERKYFIRCFSQEFEVYKKIIEASIKAISTETTETEFIRKKMILTIQNLENEEQDRLEKFASVESTTVKSEEKSEEVQPTFTAEDLSQTAKKATGKKVTMKGTDGKHRK